MLSESDKNSTFVRDKIVSRNIIPDDIIAIDNCIRDLCDVRDDILQCDFGSNDIDDMISTMSSGCWCSGATPGKATGSGRDTVSVPDDNHSPHNGGPSDLDCSASSDSAGFGTRLPPVFDCSVGSDTG